MARPKGGYKTKDGVKCVGVTTVISRFKDSGGIIYWAWEQGRDGFDFRETRDDAATAGTLAHALVEYHITKKSDAELTALIEEERVKPEILERANRAFSNYLNWERFTKLQVIQTEMALVSEKHLFGGTFDGIAVVEIEGKRALTDWKTSSAIYRDALVQVAAYKGLWEENYPDQPIEGGFHLCRFSRDHGDFSHHYFENLDEAWEQFLLLRRAYEIDKQLKKRAA
jgi:hypothetical protein